MKYLIRPMVKDDLDQVNEIDKEAFPSQWPPANYRQELQNKIAHYLVICDTTRPITVSPAPPKRRGDFLARLLRRKPDPVVILPPEPPPQYYIVGFSGIWMLAGEAHITNIAVRGECRGRGIGEHLLLSTYDLSQSQDACFMTLEVRASNIVAQGLYNKYGFMAMGVRKGYYLDNREDAIIMTTEALSSPTYQERIRTLKESLAKRMEN